MKAKQILTAVAVITLLSAGAAMAQTPTAPAAPAAAAPATTAAASKSMKKFDDYKAETLKRLAKRADEIQKKQACVTAANTPAALHACFPRWHKHHEERKAKK